MRIPERTPEEDNVGKKKFVCTKGCEKEFKSEAWRDKHEQKIHAGAVAPREHARRDGGDGSTEENPDLPEAPLKPSSESRTVATGDMKEIIESLKLKREEIIRKNPDIHKLDLAISALSAVQGG
jgi:hypothetical protein